jgi:drug/metabolite transporter (DMT)-like permease
MHRAPGAAVAARLHFDVQRNIVSSSSCNMPARNCIERGTGGMEEGDPKRPNVAAELALLLLLATLWGGSYTLIKLGVATIPPVSLIAARTAIAGSLLLAVMRVRGVRLPRDAATWRRFLLQACLNSVIPWTLIAWAERSLDAGLATILNSTSPIFAFFLTLAITRHEEATFQKLLGVLAGLAGICLIVGVQAFRGFGEQVVAQLAVVFATICYAGGGGASIRWRRRRARWCVARRSSFPRASCWSGHGRWRRHLAPSWRCLRWRYSRRRWPS